MEEWMNSHRLVYDGASGRIFRYMECLAGKIFTVFLSSNMNCAA